MRKNRNALKLVVITAALILLSGQPVLTLADDAERQYDPHCLRVGGFGAFAEMVRMGVKILALSAAMLPEEMDAFMPDAERIAKEEGVQIYREPDLLVTDLFPAEVSAGKHVVLIYKGSTLEEYLALKKEKEALVAADAYSGKAREELGRKFGKLLSYPDSTIDERVKNPRS